MHLRIWWIPQVPGKPFRVEVDTLDQARFMLKTLADYDRFQLTEHIKPDYCSVGGVETFEDGEWVDWSDEQGNGIWGPPS